MENYYSLLGISNNASSADIKKAFRENAKRLHPDIAGDRAAGKMRKLLAAYKILSDRERRYEYDRVYSRVSQNYTFDYRSFLRERKDDPVSRAKLVFFELLHLEEGEALSVWDEEGGLDFSMEQCLDREDWMDCTFILAEELANQSRIYEAFILLVRLVREERRKPYFRHFMEDIEIFLKSLARRLKPVLDGAIYLECMENLLSLGFPPADEERWLRSMADAKRKLKL